MIEAGLWGFAAASSLIIGAVLAFAFDISPARRGFILAFGAGTLLGAVAYELIEDSLADSERGIEVAIGFALGALTFYFGSVLIERMQGGDGPPIARERRSPRTLPIRRSSGRAVQGVGGPARRRARRDPRVGRPWAVVDRRRRDRRARAGRGFVSNVPEALSASEDLSASGFTKRRIIVIWVVVALVSGLASALGFGLLDTAPSFWVGLIQSFAAGAILAMLAESMIPEAYEIGGRPVGLATCVGFALAAYLSLRT